MEHAHNTLLSEDGVKNTPPLRHKLVYTTLALCHLCFPTMSLTLHSSQHRQSILVDPSNKLLMQTNIFSAHSCFDMETCRSCRHSWSQKMWDHIPRNRRPRPFRSGCVCSRAGLPADNHRLPSQNGVYSPGTLVWTVQKTKSHVPEKLCDHPSRRLVFDVRSSVVTELSSAAYQQNHVGEL